MDIKNSEKVMNLLKMRSNIKTLLHSLKGTMTARSSCRQKRRTCRERFQTNLIQNHNLNSGYWF